MSYELHANQELPPLQKRIQQAEKAFRFARIKGFPEELAKTYSSYWSSLGAERERIPQATWESLAKYGKTDEKKKPTSLQQIMQVAIEKRLESVPPEIKRPPEQQREDDVLELLSRPEFAADKTPYADLEELYSEYKTIAKNYSSQTASDYWLFTRSVRSFLQKQVDNALFGEKTEGTDTTLYQDLSRYLTNRYIQETTPFIEQAPETNQESEGKYHSIDDLYEAYLARVDKPNTNTVTWLSSLGLDISTFPKEDQLAINKYPKTRDNSIDYDYTAEIINKLLFQRYRSEVIFPENDRRAKEAEIAEKERQLQNQIPEKPKEKSSQEKELESIVQEITKGILPMAEEFADDNNALGEFVKEIADTEFSKLPKSLQDYLQPTSDDLGKSGEEKLHLKLMISVIGALPKKPKPEKKPWWKKLFGKGN